MQFAERLRLSAALAVEPNPTPPLALQNLGTDSADGSGTSRPPDAVRYGAQWGIGSATGAMGFLLSTVPALALTVVPPQGGCGCPPPPREHPCSCWAVGMFPFGTALGASTGIVLSDELLLPGQKHPFLPPLLGSMAGAAILSFAVGPAYMNGQLSTEALVPTLAVGSSLSGTLTNALFVRR